MSSAAIDVSADHGSDNRVARDDEHPRNSVAPINGVCRVYIAPPPVLDHNEVICRICHDTKSESSTPLISPCRCTGSSAHVHQACIENWLTLGVRETCDLCNYRFSVYKTMKPVKEWVWTPLELEDIVMVVVTVLAYISFIINIVAIVFQSLVVSRHADTHTIFNLSALVLGSVWAILTMIFLTLGTWCSPNWEYWRDCNSKTKLRELHYADAFLRDIL